MARAHLLNSGLAADALVVFIDEAGGEFRVEIPRQGHSDFEVRTVAFRWACKQVAEGTFRPHGELRFRSLSRVI